jgi:hypothetical protein
VLPPAALQPASNQTTAHPNAAHCREIIEPPFGFEIWRRSRFRFGCSARRQGFTVRKATPSAARLAPGAELSPQPADERHQGDDGQNQREQPGRLGRCRADGIGSPGEGHHPGSNGKLRRGSSPRAWSRQRPPPLPRETPLSPRAGRFFPEPGGYEVTALLVLFDEANDRELVLRSNTIQLRVATPKTVAEEHDAVMFFQDDFGLYLALGGSRALPRAADALNELIDRRGRKPSDPW